MCFQLKNLTLEEGVELVNRFMTKKVEVSRIWKHCSRIAELAAQFFMTAAMTKHTDEIRDVLMRLLTAWAILNDKLEGIEAIPTIMRRIIQTADSATHIYICSEVLNKKVYLLFYLYFSYTNCNNINYVFSLRLFQ